MKWRELEQNRDKNERDRETIEKVIKIAGRDREDSF